MNYKDIIEKAAWVVFPRCVVENDLHLNYADESLYKTVRYNFPNSKALLLPSGETYCGWELNNHHFSTSYHRQVVLPLLNDVLSFGYNESDFLLVPNKFENYNIGYFYQKKVNNYTVVNYTLNFSVDCSFLGYIPEYPREEHAYTKYHELYSCSHCVSKVVNHGENNGKTLLLVCDSQMIPSVPVLCKYYKEVFVFDNRYIVDMKPLYENEKFEDVVFCLWRWMDQSEVERIKYSIVSNLQGFGA